MVNTDSLGVGRGRLLQRGDEERRRHARRGYHYRRREAGRNAAAGLSRSAADGLLRAVSDRFPAVSTLRDALAKLQLNDAALTYEPESSAALGLRVPLRIPWPAAHGHRAGAAGARVRTGTDCHRARASSTGTQDDGEIIEIDNPNDLPDPSEIDRRGAVSWTRRYSCPRTTWGRPSSSAASAVAYSPRWNIPRRTE